MNCEARGVCLAHDLSQRHYGVSPTYPMLGNAGAVSEMRQAVRVGRQILLPRVRSQV